MFALQYHLVPSHGKVYSHIQSSLGLRDSMIAKIVYFLSQVIVVLIFLKSFLYLMKKIGTFVIRKS